MQDVDNKFSGEIYPFFCTRNLIQQQKVLQSGTFYHHKFYIVKLFWNNLKLTGK